MKSKFLSVLTALSICTSMTLMNTQAVENAPILYFKSGQEDSITVNVADGDVTVRVAMYVDTDSDDIGTLAIRFKSDSEYITLSNMLDPREEINEETEYTLPDGTVFSTKQTPSCFSKLNSRGILNVSGKFYFPDAETLNAETGRYDGAYSFVYTSPISSAVTWLGDDSDLYMITDFDATISADTPEGTYSIYYINDITVDENGSISQEDANNASYGVSFSQMMKHFQLDAKPLTINVINSEETTTTTTTTTTPTTTTTTSTTTTTPTTTTITSTTTTTTTSTTTTEVPDIILGDVNQDGVINASDSSEVLRAYAEFSSGKGYGLGDEQMVSADVNKDGFVNASDSSRILAYYANISSGKDDSFDE